MSFFAYFAFEKPNSCNIASTLKIFKEFLKANKYVETKIKNYLPEKNNKKLFKNVIYIKKGPFTFIF